MRISIVTLSFNQRAYLQEALDSVLSQSYQDLDYIVVDPGSTDGSREIIRSYSDRISTTIFEPDHGAAEGLNVGFGKATGDIYGFLNADDILLPGSLKCVGEFFQSHPDCDMLMGNGYKIDGRGRKTRHFIARDFSVRRFFYGGTQWLQQSTFYRADAFRAVGGFNTENRTSWDAELLFDMSLRNMELLHVPGYWSAFRIHSESITGSQRLAEESRKTHARYFRAVMGREKKSLDKLAAKFVFAYTLLTEPRGLLTRVSDRLRSVISNPKTKKLGQKHLAYRG